MTVFGTGCGLWIWEREGWEMCVCVWDRVWTVDMGEGGMGNVLLCLVQGVDMEEGGREMCFCVWDRVWIWEREDGKFVAVFGTGC